MATQQTASAAFAEAEQQRRVRAEVFADLASGALTFEQLLERIKDDQFAAKIKLLPVIESLPGMGKVTSRRLLAKLDMAQDSRLAQVADLAQLPDLLAQLELAQAESAKPEPGQPEPAQTPADEPDRTP